MRREDRERVAAIDKEIAARLKRIEEIREEDRSEQAQDIMDKLMREFKAGAAWLNKMKRAAMAKQMVWSPFGRIRHLYATLIQNQKVQAQQLRRGVNAPVQGMASEQGTVTNRQIDKTMALEKPVIEAILKERMDALQISRLVHDASYFMVDYMMVIPLYHIALYEATYGSAAYFEKHLGFKFSIEPEVEFEVSATDSGDNMGAGTKIDYSIPQFIEVIKGAVLEAEKMDLLEGTVEEVMELVFLPWTDAKCRRYLQKRFPLLGVKSDLTERNIIKEVSKHFKHTEPFISSPRAPDYYQPFNDKEKPNERSKGTGRRS